MGRSRLLPLLLLCGCVPLWGDMASGYHGSIKADPPPKKMAGCAITCPSGYMMRRQHICRGGTRWFQDVTIIDRHIVRGADGGILSDTYQTNQGDYSTQDVEIGTCQAVIARLIAARSVEERGQYPGEDPQGQPLNPPKK